MLAVVHCEYGSAFKGVPEQPTKLTLTISAFSPRCFERESHGLGLVDLRAHSRDQISQGTTAGDETFLDKLCDGGLFGTRAGGSPL